MTCSEHNEMAKTLYQLSGKIDESDKTIDKNFDILFQKIDKMNEVNLQQNLKLEKMTNDWAWMKRISGLVGFAVSLVTTILLRIFF